jgi:4-hydroxybenzoate polyprenyltransferase
MRSDILALAERTAASQAWLDNVDRPLVIDVNELIIQSPALASDGRSELPGRLLGIIRSVAGLTGERQSPHLDPASPAFDPSKASYNPDAMTYLLRAMNRGRPIYISSELGQEWLVSSVAQYLGVFSGWSSAFDRKYATEGSAELPPELHRGFDYIGSRTTSLPELSSRVDIGPAAFATSATRVGVRTWLKLLRVHQYAKNTLVFVPLATAHKFVLASGITALTAAIAFSLCASVAYMLNDILDVEADRVHSSKRHRPIASGAISPTQAGYAMSLAFVAALAIAASISLEFFGVLLGYFVLTTLYSFWLKRIAIVDVVVLASLYCVRVIGGAVAIDVVVSEWLLAFSLFIFMSLALVKRYVELDGQPKDGLLAARDYRATDKPMIAILAGASGFNAAVIYTLYISSETVRSLYSHPQLLWVGCPVLMYWIGRVMLFAQRGLIHDDPIVFALKDRVSWAILAAFGSIMLFAL